MIRLHPSLPLAHAFGVALALAFGLVAIPLSAPGALAGEGADAAEATNVHVTIRIGGEQNGEPLPARSYSLVGVAGQGGMSLLGGERVPIPTTTFNTATAASSQPSPVTSYSYQNVGFTAQVEANLLPDGRIRLSGTIESSQLVPTTVASAGAQPQVATFEQRFLVVLDSGEPVRVMNAEGTLRTVWFEVEATAGA